MSYTLKCFIVCSIYVCFSSTPSFSGPANSSYPSCHRWTQFVKVRCRRCSMQPMQVHAFVTNWIVGYRPTIRPIQQRRPTPLSLCDCGPCPVAIQDVLNVGTRVIGLHKRQYELHYQYTLTLGISCIGCPFDQQR